MLSRLLAVLSTRLFGYVLLYTVLLYLGRCAVATVAVCGFGSWSLVFDCGLPRQISPLPPTPSQTAVCSTMGESIRPSSFHNPTLSANKHVVQIYRSSLSAAVHCSSERRTSPFNGIEGSLSRAVVIKTKSLPISATTFATALSLYIAHDGRKHEHNPTLSANKHVVQICRSSLSAAADGLADGSSERRTSPVNGIERSLSRAVVPKTKSLPVSATTFPTALSLYFAQERLRKDIDIRPLSKLFSKAEPLPFEKEININWPTDDDAERRNVLPKIVFCHQQSILECLTLSRNKHQLGLLFLLRMQTKCCWVISGRLTSERKASTSPSSFINHSTLLLDRALKRQAPSLYSHALRALDRLRRQNASTRRRGNHMHDHSRFQRDIDDVTGALSLSLSLSTTHKSH